MGPGEHKRAWGEVSLTGIPGVLHGAGRAGGSLSGVQPCWLSQDSLNVPCESLGQCLKSFELDSLIG